MTPLEKTLNNFKGLSNLEPCVGPLYLSAEDKYLLMRSSELLHLILYVLVKRLLHIINFGRK